MSDRVVFQPAVGQRVQQGIHKIVAAVVATLGPRSRGVVLKSYTHPDIPEYLDDAALIARCIIELADRDEDIGAMLVRKAIWTVRENAGDGAALTAVLFESIYDEGLKYIAAGGSAAHLRTHEKESGVLFTGTESHGLWRSPDHGQTWARVGADAIPADTNSVLLSARYPACPDLLVLTSTALLLSRDDGASWHDVTPDAGQDRGLTCVAAPLGLDPGAPLLAGLDDGTVLCLPLPMAGDD